MNNLTRMLLATAMEAAPTSVEQQGFTNMVHQMEKDGLDRGQVATALAGALHDGMLHGNWPKGEKE